MKPHQKFIAESRAARRPKAVAAPVLTAGEVWLAAWTAVASASDCGDFKIAINWADSCQKSYAKRFDEKGRPR